MLQTYSLPETIERFTSALKDLTRRLGLDRKYHETISWFYLIMIAERRSGAAATDWMEFKRLNPDLLKGGSALLESYYSRARLHSEIARQIFILPDSPHQAPQGR
jgi:hypothetical protein